MIIMHNFRSKDPELMLSLQSSSNSSNLNHPPLNLHHHIHHTHLNLLLPIHHQDLSPTSSIKIKKVLEEGKHHFQMMMSISTLLQEQLEDQVTIMEPCPSLSWRDRLVVMCSLAPTPRWRTPGTRVLW